MANSANNICVSPSLLLKTFIRLSFILNNSSLTKKILPQFDLLNKELNFVNFYYFFTELNIYL